MTSTIDTEISPLVAIDVGQTGTRAVVIDAGERTLYEFDSRASPAAFASSPDLPGVRVVAEQLAASGAATAVVGIALSGFDERSDYREMSRVLGSILRSPIVHVASDAAAALVGSVGVRPGVCVSWGTGVVALSADANGAWWRVDGRGFLLGDAGGGSWIGRRGILSGLDHLERRGGSALLAEALISAFGDPAQLHDQVYGPDSPASLFARFAPQVLRCVDEGDETARSIVKEAAAEVAKTIDAATARLATAGELQVGLTGGLAQVGSPQIAELRRLTEMYHPPKRITIHPSAPLDGAVMIAAGQFDTNLLSGLIRTWNRG